MKHCVQVLQTHRKFLQSLVKTLCRIILWTKSRPFTVLRAFEFTSIPSNTSVHFCRHVHALPYVSSLRNDRQEKIDGDAAPRCSPVDMILDINAEELMVMANKRLCAQAAPVTRAIMQGMAKLAGEATPEIRRFLVPMCQYHGGTCHEMRGCGACPPFTVFR